MELFRATEKLAQLHQVRHLVKLHLQGEQTTDQR